MSVADFETSAAAAAPVMGAPASRWVSASVARSRRRARPSGRTPISASCCLPHPSPQPRSTWRGAISRRALATCCDALTVQDARDTYRGDPHGGAGRPRRGALSRCRRRAARHPARSDACGEARDRIAWNYAHGFSDIFGLGLAWLKQARERWGDSPFAVTRVYLGFLAHLPDTLIERKFGADVAASLLEEARPMEAGLLECALPRGHDRAADGLRPSAQGARAEPRHIGRSHGGDALCRSARGAGKPPING